MRYKDGIFLTKGPFTPGVSVNVAKMPVIQLSTKTIESLQNGLQPYSGVNPLFSMRAVSLLSSQRCRSVDADAWCKRTFKRRSIYL